MELEIFEALTAINVPPDKARAAVASLKKEINEHYALHAQQLATRGDVELVRKELAEAETRLTRAISEMQKWTMMAVFGGMAAVAAIIKLIP